MPFSIRGHAPFRAEKQSMALDFLSEWWKPFSLLAKRNCHQQPIQLCAKRSCRIWPVHVAPPLALPLSHAISKNRTDRRQNRSLDYVKNLVLHSANFSHSNSLVNVTGN